MRTQGLIRRHLHWMLTSGLAASAVAGCGNRGGGSGGVRPAAQALAVPMAPSHVDARLWRGGQIPPVLAATPADSAIALVGRLAPQWGAPNGAAALAPLATIPVAGGHVVRLDQRVDGIAIDGGELRVLVGRGGSLIAASGRLAAADLPRDKAGFRLSAADATARAVAELHQVPFATAALRQSKTSADEAWFAGGSTGVTVDQARARKRWFRDGDALVAAWVVEAYTSLPGATDGLAYRTVIGARDGRVLRRVNLSADAVNYRVWADTTGDKRPADGPTADVSPYPSAPGAARPGYVAPSLITIDGGLNHPGDGNPPDPWLAPGATVTTGNNVDAYADIMSPNHFSNGDLRASATGTDVFDRVYDPAQGPQVSQTQEMASLTDTFYTINWLHDDWYDAGFTEAAGNAQADNYGRGGQAGDAMLAEGQDFGGRNNANMNTPDDGMSPVMQMYLWSGPEVHSLVISPNTTVSSRGAAFGPLSYDFTGQLVAGDDAMMTVTDGCETLTNAVAMTGKIVLLDRGTCSFKKKALNAQNAGASAVVIANNVTGNPPTVTNDTSITTAITIPAMSVTMADGASLRTQMNEGAVTLVMHRVSQPDTDGGVDTTIVTHEFGHYLHHRLSRCDTNQCGGMSEGWGDFNALLLVARDGDNLDGSFPLSGYAYNGDPYFGIRRAPYSTDMTKNAFTFRLVADGQSLPTSAPLGATGGTNSEVHNTGEIWAETMWEGYVALQKARGAATFAETRKKMQRIVVAGLLMSPPDATFTEVRDAMLAAAEAENPTDRDTLLAAYARRGFGSCAVAPPRESDDNVGAIESFQNKGNAAVAAPAFVVDVTDCDHDTALDVGETGTVTIPVANTGSMTLDAVTVAIATSTPGLTITNPSVSLGAMGPHSAQTATFQVTLDAATAPTAGAIDVTVSSPGSCNETQHLTLPVVLDTDDKAEASATDSFDAADSPWTPDGASADQVWKHSQESALDRIWHGADLGTDTDTSLISPEMVAGSGTVKVEFDHSYDFEFSNNTYWDGGLIEITTDGGATWVDVSTLATVPYTGTLGGDSGNPLQGRDAFGSSASGHVILDFGSQLAGQTFQLRFRIGTDGGVGADGWTIDDLAVSGLANKPFPVQGADGGACTGGGGDDGGEPGGCCSTGAPHGADVAAGALVLGLIIRRRRRK